jgi:AGCS family alanine or glycine:cation symporter
MYYLDRGLKEKGKYFGIFGKILGAMYAVFIIGGAFGGGNMFQANQSYELFGKLIGIPDYLYGIILAVMVAFVIVGGIKRIGQTTEKIVPFMVVLYVGASLFIIITNLDKLPGVLSSMLSQAFPPEAAYGGFIGALVTGIKRAVFSNEGGVGSASIAHSAAKTDEPVREGIVAMIGPFIDTIVATIPSLTGSSVLAAEWAIEADPTPPSLLKTALLIPVTKAPIKPP